MYSKQSMHAVKAPARPAMLIPSPTAAMIVHTDRAGKFSNIPYSVSLPPYGPTGNVLLQVSVCFIEADEWQIMEAKTWCCCDVGYRSVEGST